MSLGENKLHPLQIEDAREAAYRSSEIQRDVENSLRDAARDLAEAERAYRERLSVRIMKLHAGEGDTKGLAITTCETVAKGEKDVAQLRYDRDVKRGILEAKRQQAYRHGADRKSLDSLINWSMRRDLRTDTQPPGFDRPPPEPSS